MPENAMSEILTNVTTFFTQVVGWVGDLIDMIVANPVLLIFVVCLPIAGYAIGYLKRLLNA